MYVVIADKPGRLANRLTVFAHLIAGSLTHGYSLINPAFDEYARFFEGTRRSLLSRYPSSGSREWSRASRAFVFHMARFAAAISFRLGTSVPFVSVRRLAWGERSDVSLQDLCASPKAHVAFVQGWLFRNEECLVKHATAIRQFFTPVEGHRQASASLAEGARSAGNLLIGIHIRQGDYREHRYGKYFFRTEAYARVAGRVAELFPNERVSFLICSDVPQSRDQFSGLDATIASSGAVEELYALARCDYLIGPPSSFTLWASFYGEVPLFMMTSAEAEPRLERFVVAPLILDEDVRALH